MVHFVCILLYCIVPDTVQFSETKGVDEASVGGSNETIVEESVLSR